VSKFCRRLAAVLAGNAVEMVDDQDRHRLIALLQLEAQVLLHEEVPYSSLEVPAKIDIEFGREIVALDGMSVAWSSSDTANQLLDFASLRLSFVLNPD